MHVGPPSNQRLLNEKSQYYMSNDLYQGDAE